MTPYQVSDKLLVWGRDIEPKTIAQASASSRLPIVEGHIALMPDAHVGRGSTVGSVIPTNGAVIPAAVGVDIGCGMIATETRLTAEDLPDSLDPMMKLVEEQIPAGVGQGHSRQSDYTLAWLKEHPPPGSLTPRQEKAARTQLGTLGSGNHFLEVCLDERDVVWVVLHSGSRGIGNQLAQVHINKAKKIIQENQIPLEDPDLAYLNQGTAPFEAYINDMLWAQDYALANREFMMDEALNALARVALQLKGESRHYRAAAQYAELRRINCHHNFTQLERHFDKELWITRKGAIKADTNDLGVIPGSMGTKSYIVQGKGNPESYVSCSHGAGRRLSRTQAKKQFTADNLRAHMQGKSWNEKSAQRLIDEIPDSYKPIDDVMEDQADLVTVQHTLSQILNYKGQ